MCWPINVIINIMYTIFLYPVLIALPSFLCITYSTSIHISCSILSLSNEGWKKFEEAERLGRYTYLLNFSFPIYLCYSFLIFYPIFSFPHSTHLLTFHILHPIFLYFCCHFFTENLLKFYKILLYSTCSERRCLLFFPG